MNTFRETTTYNDYINLEEYTVSITGYITECIEDVTVSRNSTTKAKEKPWFTVKVRARLRERDAVFNLRDRAALRTARPNLSCSIRPAKHDHAQKIQSNFHNTKDARRL